MNVVIWMRRKTSIQAIDQITLLMYQEYPARVSRRARALPGTTSSLKLSCFYGLLQKSIF